MPWSSEFGDMNLEATRVQTSWLWLSEFEMHLGAMIERVWRCTWRPWLSGVAGVLGGGQSGGGSSGGRRERSWEIIHWWTHNCGNVENWVQHGLQRDERLVGSRRQLIMGWCSMRCMQYSVYALLGVCCTRCMMTSLYAVPVVCCTSSMRYSVLTLDHCMER